MARAGGKCTDRLNHRNGTNSNRQAIRLEPMAGSKPASYKNYIINPEPSKGYAFEDRHFFSSSRINQINDSINNESERKEW